MNQPHRSDASGKPPRWAHWLLRTCCAPDRFEELEGDLQELFEARRTLRGERAARRQYVRDVLSLLQPFTARPHTRPQTVSPLLLSPAMLQNYLKIALRSLRNHPLTAGAQVVGLALGIACCLLIGLYLQRERAYDQHHPATGQLYRIALDRNYVSGEQKAYATSALPLAGLVRQSVPEITQVARSFSPQWTSQKTLVRQGKQRDYEARFLFADSTFFELFAFAWVEGDPATALRRPGSVVLRETMARKYFGEGSPLGRQLIVNDSLRVEVTGVLKDDQAPSHLKADFIASFDLLQAEYGDLTTLWGWDLAYTYVRLTPGTRPEAVGQKVAGLIRRELPDFREARGYEYGVSLQAVPDLHLHSDRQWELEPGGSATYVQALLLTALLVLLVSVCNAVGLQISRLTARVAETGVRRTLGARGRQLPLQWAVESAILLGFALLLGTGLTAAGLPLLESLTGQTYRWADFSPETVLGLILGGGVLMLVLTSAVPVAYFSRLSIPQALKRKLPPGHFYERLGKGLLVGQFAVCIFLLSATLVLHRQMQYLTTKELGFQRENVLIVKGYGIGERLPLLREAFGRVPGVREASATSGLPGSNIEKMRIRAEGDETLRPVDMLWVDEGFVQTLGMKILQGRDFSRQFGSDSLAAYLLNETAARQLGWTQPVGKRLAWQGREGTVVGVVADIHHASLHQPVEPLVLLIRPSGYNVLAVRYEGNSRELIGRLQREWRRLVPDRPFEYDFVDRQLARQYEAEERFSRVIGLFTGLSLLVAGLGLLAISALVVERRTREMGIRKVLGASLGSLVGLLTTDFFKLLGLALLIASPVAWGALDRWLANFAYHVGLSGWVFLLAGLLAAALVGVVVGLQGLRLAGINPVRSLRSE